MAGYTKQDTADNIANGKVIDADDFNAEFVALQSAFNASTGHTHSGLTGEGAPIERVGPSQDLVVTNTNVNPKSSNTLDLGTDLLQYKNAYFDGTVYQDSAIVGVNEYMTLSDNGIDVSTGGLTIDVVGDITLDADGGDILLNDAGVTFATLTNDSNNLIVKSGTTTAITLSGADATLAGTLAVTSGTTFNGDVTVSSSNSVTLDSGSLTMSSGNATIGGDLSVTGEITATGGITGDVTGDVTGNADTATTLATARNITIDGDVDATATSFDGSSDITLTTTLDTVNYNVGSFGSSTSVPVVTVNAKGLVTAVSTSSITTSLTVGADSGTDDAVSLESDTLNFAGTTNEIETSVSNNQIQIGLPSDVTIGNDLTVTGEITATGGITGDLTGDVTKSGSFTVDASGDIKLDADSGNFYFADNGSTKLTFVVDGGSGQTISSTNSLVVQGGNASNEDLTLTTSGRMNLNASGAVFGTQAGIALQGTGAQRGVIDLSTASQISFRVGTGNSPSEELRLTTSGVGVLGGLRVGDSTAPTDNDIYAAADIEAGGNVSAGGEIQLTGGSSNWTFEVGNNDLLIVRYNGNGLFRIDSSGNVTAKGNVTPNGNF